jgi:hypothetical protein
MPSDWCDCPVAGAQSENWPLYLQYFVVDTVSLVLIARPVRRNLVPIDMSPHEV